MPYRVSQEPVADVLSTAVEVLNATRRSPESEARFRWLYQDNPDGEAAVWTIRDTKTGESAGLSAALPRRVSVDGETRLCWNTADFSILPKHRSLGAALKLRRAAKEEVDHGSVDFLYGHPNDRMKIVNDRSGYLPIGPMVRYALPIDARPYLQPRLGTMLAAAGGAIASLSLHRRIRRHRYQADIRFEESPQFDDRFDDLNAKIASRGRIVGIRDTRYLRWRWAKNPLYKTHGIVACRDNHIVGYLLFTQEGKHLLIRDLVCLDDAMIARDLATALVRHGKRHQLHSAYTMLLQGHPLQPVLEQIGFSAREETSTMYGYASETSPLRSVIESRESWIIMVGDRDV